MIGWLATLGVVAAAPQAAVPPASGSWSIDYGQRYCSLIRKPADAALPALTFRQTPGSSPVELLIAGRGWRSGINRLQQVDIVLQPSGFRNSVEAVPMGDGAGLSGIGVAYLPATLFDHLDKSDALVVENKGKPVVAIVIPAAHKALRALVDCNDRVLADLGVDTKRQATFRSEAMPLVSPATWFTSQDYPTAALNSGVSDKVVALVSVAADGKVTGCRIAASDGNAALDEQTCRLVMMRARYAPALDADAKPVDSKVLLNILWVSP